MLALLRRRDFGLLWLGGFVSVTGDWVLNVALPFFVFERTGSTIATAGMIVAELVPGVVLGTVAGVFVDRWNRKHVLVVGNALSAAVVALLLLVPGGGPLALVYVVAIAQASVAAFMTTAESALLPSLVGDADLVAANALNALNNRLGRLVGVPLGGALLGFIGLEAVVLVDCGSFVLAALLIVLIGAPARAARADDASSAEAARSALGAFFSDWVEGMRIIRRERTIGIIFVVFGLMTFGGTMLDPLYVAWVRETLHRGPEVYSWLLLTHALAGIGGTLVVGRFGARLTPRMLMGWTSLYAGIANAVKFNIPSLTVAVAITVSVGITSVASAVGVETLAQRGVPDHLRGRVFGALGASGALLSLLGALVGGTLAAGLGVVAMLDVSCALIALSGIVVLRALRGHDAADRPRVAAAA